MKKYILLLISTLTISYAGLVNGIAVIINDKPITLYDIDKKMEQDRLSKRQAVEKIMDDLLYDNEIKQHNISVDLLEIDNYIQKLADTNNMDVLDFKALIRQQQDYEAFKESVKKRLIHDKLVRKIVSGNLKRASTQDIELFYQNNHEQYKIADTLEVIAYVSKDKKLLESLKSNPLMKNNAILVQSLTLKQDELNPKVKYVLNATKEKSFSSVFVQNETYNMFYVTEKKDITAIPLEQVETKIFNQIMQKRENNYLKEYFESLKITADTKILR